MDGRGTKQGFLDAARDYFERGWVTIPLGLDSEGRPKKPLDNGWPETPLEWEAIESHAWGNAHGLGVVLGRQSGNLGVIDIDDVGLAERCWSALSATPVPHWFVSTIRKRGHLYLIERNPSHSSKFTVEYQGRQVTVELKAQGTQVAAPPTPGYTHLGAAESPVTVNSLAEAWNALAAVVGVRQERSQSQYPRAWQDTVTEGERNNSLFVESCRLREAGMPIRSAIEVLLTRARVSYSGQVDEHELIRTVQSAYRRISTKTPGGARGGVAV